MVREHLRDVSRPVAKTTGGESGKLDKPDKS
jgi:hypothetical protein